MKVRGGGEVVENGHPAPHMVPHMGPPPAVSNGYGPRMDLETEIAQHTMPPPNMAEPPPNMVPPPPYPPPHPLLMLPSMVGPPPPVMLSPQGQVVQTTPPQYQPEVVPGEEAQLEVDISNMSISEKQSSPRPSCEDQGEEAGSMDHPKVQREEQQRPPLTKDLFNLYSLSFVNKSKDLSERRIRLDFGLAAEVSRVRGQLGRLDATLIVSFDSAEDCYKCLAEKSIITKYPTLVPAPCVNIVADRDGYFSIEFTNAGMSGVREITNEFSRHGEIVKVQQGGARNAVKRVTVSYADLEAAMGAISHYANSNDVRGIDFVAECVESEGSV